MPPVAILAGGLATRLRHITEKIPKSLVTVAGRPFLAHQLEYLRDQGITSVVLCVGHLGEMVREQFGDGAAWGLRLQYSSDGDVLLGTAGALRRALPLLGERFFVLYGDSYLLVQYGAVERAFAASGKQALMTVFRNEGRWDTSNVRFEDGEIRAYDKRSQAPDMQFIDYGLSMFHASALEAVPPGEVRDLAGLMKQLVEAREMAGFEAAERFYEIGSPAGLAELNTYLEGRL